MASFAVAGFAAFAPTTEAAPEPVEAAVESAFADISANPELGLRSGRVAAMNFSSTNRPTPDTTITLPDVDSLIAVQSEIYSTTTTVYVAPAAVPRQPRNDTTPATAEGWRPLVEAHFAAADVDRALLVIHCESSGDPNVAHPSSGAAGLFQHLPKFWEERSTKAGIPGANIFDPESNVIVAAWLVYSGGGWRHWNPSAHCWG